MHFHRSDDTHRQSGSARLFPICFANVENLAILGANRSEQRRLLPEILLDPVCEFVLLIDRLALATGTLTLQTLRWERRLSGNKIISQRLPYLRMCENLAAVSACQNPTCHRNSLHAGVGNCIVGRRVSIVTCPNSGAAQSIECRPSRSRRSNHLLIIYARSYLLPGATFQFAVSARRNIRTLHLPARRGFQFSLVRASS